MSTRTDAWARRVGLALGLLLALAAVLSWRIPALGAGLGADAHFVAAPPGELTVEPSGAFLAARGLEPGDMAGGQLRIRNITGAAVAVRLRARPSSRELDPRLIVELRDGAVTLHRGRLGRLRSWLPPLPFARGEARTLAARAWLATGAPGASVDVTFELRAEVGGG